MEPVPVSSIRVARNDEEMRARCSSLAGEDATQRAISRIREQVERRKEQIRREGGARIGREARSMEWIPTTDGSRSMLRETRTELGKLRSELNSLREESEMLRKRSNRSESLALLLLERSRNGLREIEEKNGQIRSMSSEIKKYEVILEEKARDLAEIQAVLEEKMVENQSLRGEILGLRRALRTVTRSISCWTSSLFRMKHKFAEEVKHSDSYSTEGNVGQLLERFEGAFMVLQDISQVTDDFVEEVIQESMLDEAGACTKGPLDLETSSCSDESTCPEDIISTKGAEELVEGKTLSRCDVAIEEGGDWVLYRFLR